MSSKVLNFLKIVGGIVGFASALTIVAFFMGYFAIKSHYALVDLPVLYIDYLAYAETGLQFIVDTVAILIKSPVTWVLVALTIVLFACSEFEPLRRLMRNPLVLPVIAVLAVVGTSSLALQQLKIRDTKINVADGVYGIPDIKMPLVIQPAKKLWEGKSKESLQKIGAPEESFQRMADEIRGNERTSSYTLPLRPLPKGFFISEKKGERGLLGARMNARYSPAAEAKRIYRFVVSCGILGLWMCIILFVSYKYQMRRYLLERKAGTDQKILQKNMLANRLVYRWKEEIWASVKWIFLPVLYALLFANILFLFPISYGALHIDAVGKERVRVHLNETATNQVEEPRSELANASLLRSFLQDEQVQGHEDQISECHNLAIQYATADRLGRKKEIMKGFGKICQSLQGDPTSDEILERISDATRQVSDELAAIALDVKRTRTQDGYLLHYPRGALKSPGSAQIRLLEPGIFDASWRVHQFPSDIEIIEVLSPKSRVADKLEEYLKLTTPSERSEMLVEIILLGHPNSLEILLAAAHDPHPDVSGPAITSIGAYAASLESSDYDNRRRERAIDHLINMATDRNRLTSHRAAAITAVHYALNGYRAVSQSSGSSLGKRTTERLLGILNDPNEGWEVKGTAITSVAKIGQPESILPLTKILADTNTPLRIRRSIPSALMLVGTHPDSLRTLRAILTDPSSDENLIGPATLAYGHLSPRMSGEVHQTLTDLLKLTDNPEHQMLFLILLSENGLKGKATPILSRYAIDKKLKTSVRQSALIGLNDLEDVTARPTLMFIAGNPDEDLDLRILALLAWSEVIDFGDAERMLTIYKQGEFLLREAVKAALQNAANEGNGAAAGMLMKIQELEMSENLNPSKLFQMLEQSEISAEAFE